MFTWIIDKIITFFTTITQALSWIFGFIFNHLWALFLTLFSILFSIISSIISTVKGWLLELVTPIESEYDFGSEISDVIDNAIMQWLPADSFVGSLSRDCLYVINLGSLISSILSIVFPVLLSVFTYRVIKSWIPTVSGG